MALTAFDPDIEKRINQIIGGIRNLPTPPIVFEQIQKVINDPNASSAKVAKILGEDAAMSVKVLKLTNSAFYGLSREVESVKHAVTIIGLEAVRNLVLSASVLNMFKSDNANKEFHEEFWRHSLATAVAARVIAQKFKNGTVFNPDPAFTSGLVHDIGRIVICCFLPADHARIMDELRSKQELLVYEAEEKILGFNHAHLGSHLIKSWKLPDRMAEAIAFHHNPQDENSSQNYAHLVCLADHLAHVAFPTTIIENSHHMLPAGVSEILGLDETGLEGLKGNLMEEYMKAETFMKMAGVG
jgi:HD-like signal output (HDOD) protein